MEQRFFFPFYPADGKKPPEPLPEIDLDAAWSKDPEQRKNWREQKHMIAFGLQNTRARIPVMVDVLIAPPLDIEQALARAVERDVDGLSIKLAAVDDIA